MPLFKIYSDKEDLDRVKKVLARGHSWANGQEIIQFEEKISEYLGAKYAVSFNSGTSALHSILLAYNIKKGDEIIVPSFTFIATANAALFVGAKPVFADIEEKTYGLNPEDVNEKISEKTKAIIPIHYGGCPCLIRELREIAQDHDILLIEDTAQSMGAKIKNQYAGTFGDAGLFSFCQNKIITTGEGGAITTDSKDIYERLKLIRSHGRLETNDYFMSDSHADYITLGYNFRMPSICAALGLSQINKIDQLIKSRRENADYLKERLSKYSDLILPNPPFDYYHVYQMYTIGFKDIKNHRDDLMNYLLGRGITTKVYFDPVHLSAFYRQKFEYKAVDLPNTERISKCVFTLYPHPLLKKEELDYICEEIGLFFERYSH